MQRREFAKIVRQLEGRAKRLPRLYRWGVLAQALFGMLFFYAVFVVGLALAVAGVGAWFLDWGDPVLRIFAAVVGVFSIGFAVRALSFRFEPPTGVEAKRADYPELWRVIDEQRAQLNAGRVHQVLLTSDFGASLVQTPRRGIVFGYRTTVLCGVPLMLRLSADQFATVIAHELGHLADRDGATTAWGFRVQRVWSRVLEQTREKPRHPMAIFANWFVPRFNARSVVLCRAMELRADRASAELCGVETVGETLLRAHFATPSMRRFWEQAWRRAAVDRDSPVTLFAELAETESEEDESTVRAELARELAVRTEPDSTHPSLLDRLDAIGYLSRHGTTLEAARESPAALASALPIVPPPKRSAARDFLGDRFEESLATVGEAWATDVSETWDQRWAELLHRRGHLQLLNARLADGTLTPDEAVERARCVEMLEGDDRLQPALELAIARHPTSAVSHFQLGRLLLERHDGAGVPLIERAIELDPTAIELATNVLRTYHVQRNDHEAAERAAQRLDEAAITLELANHERSNLALDAEFAAHELPPQDVRRIVAVLRTLVPVDRAYLVKRVVQRYPEVPCYALVVFVTGAWRFWKTRAWVTGVAYELASRVRYTDHNAVHFVLGDDQVGNALRARFKKHRVHCIYDRRRRATGGRV